MDKRKIIHGLSAVMRNDVPDFSGNFKVICAKSLDSSDASDMQQSSPRLAAYFMALASGPWSWSWP